MNEYPPNCDMDFSHCDGVNCPHGSPYDYHDCGDNDCRAMGAPLAYPPDDYTEAQVEAYVREFHETPCPPKPTAAERLAERVRQARQVEEFNARFPDGLPQW